MREALGPCVFCHEPVRSKVEGRLCEGCRYPVHRRCMDPDAAASQRSSCSVCGSDLVAARRGERQLGPSGSAIGRILRPILGVLFLALAALGLLPALAALGSGRSAAFIIGSFVPMFLLAGMGFYLVRPR